MRKKYFGIFVLLVFAVGLFGCGGGGEKVSNKYGSVNFSIDLRNAKKFAGPTISKVTATITASDIDPIVVNLTEDQGIWKGTATVRVGKNREIKLEVFDQDNIVIYKNCQQVVIEVKEGQNPVNISLCSVTGEVVINGVIAHYLVYNVNRGGRLIVDDTNIYFIENGTPGTIKSIPKTGGTITTLATNQNNIARCLGTDGIHVYWSEYITNATLRKVPISGGDFTNILTGLNKPYSLALDSVNIYWSQWEAAGRISKIPKSGGTPTTIVSGATYPVNIVIDSNNVYWAEGMCAEYVKRVPLTGGTPTTLYTAPSGYNVSVKAVDSTDIYFHENVCGVHGVGKIKKIPLGGGTATTLASGINNPGDIYIDSTNVYFVERGTSPNFSDGSIKKVSKSGGAVTTLLSSLNEPHTITGDATNIYWIEFGTSANNYTDGKLGKMAK